MCSILPLSASRHQSLKINMFTSILGKQTISVGPKTKTRNHVGAALSAFFVSDVTHLDSGDSPKS